MPVCSPCFLLLTAQPSPSAPQCVPVHPSVSQSIPVRPPAPGTGSPSSSGADPAQPAQRAPATLRAVTQPGLEHSTGTSQPPSAGRAFHRHIPALISRQIIPGHRSGAEPALPALPTLETASARPGLLARSHIQESRSQFPPGCACLLSLHPPGSAGPWQQHWRGGWECPRESQVGLGSSPCLGVNSEPFGGAPPGTFPILEHLGCSVSMMFPIQNAPACLRVSLQWETQLVLCSSSPRSPWEKETSWICPVCTEISS